MSKANVVALVAMYGRGQEDATQIDKYYADLMWDIAQAPAFVVASLATVTAGVAEYDWPDSAANMIAVFYDDEWLRPASVDEAAIGFGDNWRDRRGRPLVYVTEPISERRIRLCPIPDATSDPLIPLHAAPLGLDYPRGALCWFVTERRDNVPTEFDVPLALGVLAREFARESNHRDQTFADACANASQLFGGWLA